MNKWCIYVGDFETTVYKNQTFTEVWASALVEIGSEDVFICNSISKTFDYLTSLKKNCIVYYHNLKFDGEFWIYYLAKILNFKQAVLTDEDNPQNTEFLKARDMPNKTFTYTISDRGQWYRMVFKVNNNVIELRDSYKLLPFSVKDIGKAFKTKHQKTEIEYTGYRKAGGLITEAEQEYIKNDVLVVKEALEFMFSQNHNKLTIGACCLSEYKNIVLPEFFKAMFPNLLEYTLNHDEYGASNADEYIRRSYKGGWCYVVKKKQGKIYKNGVSADVNSLYPSMMHSMSGNWFPVGYPRFWKGNEIPQKAKEHNRYYFIRIKTRFKIKKNKLPFIQIKGNLLYDSTECLETSDYYDKKTQKYYRYLQTKDGEKIDTRVTLTLTCTDYKLFREHYNVSEFEILDGCYFNTEIGLFDEYIDRYKTIKMNSTGAMRTLAKLFLNNLYGKLATNDNSSFKLLQDKNEDEITFIPIPQHNKPVVYIPAGSAVTSYARNFTIRTAQANYHGVNKKGFIYADTDSIHCDLSVNELVNVPIHESEFCHWKIESSWDTAIFARQKTYIEHITHEDMKQIENPYYNIKCAGMPDRCKKLLNYCLTNTQPTDDEINKLNTDEIDFLYNETGALKEMTLEDFKIGLKVPGKLTPKRIKGGVILTETEFTMRG